MDTAYRIIDRWMNQTKRCNCSFACVCLPPDECAHLLNCQTDHIHKQSVGMYSASESHLARIADQKTGERCYRIARSNNAKHHRFNTCTAARPRPPPRHQYLAFGLGSVPLRS